MSYPTDAEIAGCTSWCAPIHMVAKAIAGQQFARFFVIEDFMCMGRIHRTPRPDLILNKHSLTRRYLNLDAHGHAYRYYEPKDRDSKSDGMYRRYTNLIDAIDDLELHLMPWMAGSEFLDQNLGLSWADRWEHPDVIAWYARRPGYEQARRGRRTS